MNMMLYSCTMTLCLSDNFAQKSVILWSKLSSLYGMYRANQQKSDTNIVHYSDVIMGVMVSQITSLTIVYSNVYSGTDQRKLESSASLAFVWGIHWWPVNSPHKWPVTRKMFPFDDIIMYPVCPWESTNSAICVDRQGQQGAGPHLNIKTVFPRHGDSHVKDKKAVRPSYLWHGDLYTGKMKSLYWDDPLVPSIEVPHKK